MRPFRYSVVVLTLLFIAFPLAAKDFAPCAPRSPTALQMAQAAGWDSCQGIPSAEQVGIPAPPDGEVVSVASGGMGLPGVTLLSPAPVNEVVDFYKKSLLPSDGWKWNDVLGIYYRGDSVSGALSLNLPSVRVFPVTDPAAESFLVAEDYRSKTKTKIEIHYKPVRSARASPASQG